MPVPDYQSLMLPVLQAFANGVETSISIVRERVATAEGLASEDLAEMLPSGRQTVFTNRVSWAIVHMSRAGLVEQVRRGAYRLTTAGQHLLSKSPERIDLKLLQKYQAYIEWQEQFNPTPPPKRNEDTLGEEFTPEEVLEYLTNQLNNSIEADMLNRIRKCSPAFFEKIVLDLLLAMGYGGGNASKGRVTGKPGDGGIDGKIEEDALGLDEVYFQAKRYADDKNVGESDLRNFAGALDAKSTTKGVFLTTSSFTRSALDFVKQIHKRIVMIDGERLATLMVKYDIGTRTRVHYEIKRIDEDYFDEEGV